MGKSAARKPGAKIRLCFQPKCRNRVAAGARFCHLHQTEESRAAESKRDRVCFEAGCKAKAKAGGYFCAEHVKAVNA